LLQALHELLFFAPRFPAGVRFFSFQRINHVSVHTGDTTVMELLAPAGTVPAFEAALQEGADAVYIGAPGLNARALSRDFTFGEIAALVTYAHDQGKKVYVAMNSLVKESEIGLALESLQRFAKIAPDGLIIQDLGLLHLIRRYFPSLKVHASTLTTVNTAMGANFFHGLGFERVVLARELNLEEIRAIHERSPVELEIFIHGAMCFSYSGLCRFSSLHGGKSSLRGQCVQPCRRRYDWLAPGKNSHRGSGGRKGGYLFSMNDLCGIENLAAIRDTGVVSLKIEGRLKSVAYVRNVVRAYRLALDALDRDKTQQFEALEAAQRYLDAAMGRKRSTGFFIGGREDRMIMPHLSGSSGTLVGKVTRIDHDRGKAAKPTLRLLVNLQMSIETGDRLRLYEERSGERKSFTLRTMEVKGKSVERGYAGQTVTLVVADVDFSGLYKVSHGLLFRVDVSRRGENQRSALAAKASATPAPALDSGTLQRQLVELGVEVAHKLKTVGKSRRLQTAGGEVSGKGRSGGPEWWLKVASIDGARQHFPFKVARIVLDVTPGNVERALRTRSRKGKGTLPVVWALAPLLSGEHLVWSRWAIQELHRQGADAFQISHIGQMSLLSDFDPEKGGAPPKIYGDYTCNVLNAATLHAYAQTGMSGVQVSVEIDRATVQDIVAHRRQAEKNGADCDAELGMYVYGRPPLFSARLHAPHLQGQRTFASSRGERYFLENRPEALYAYSHSAYSLLAHVQDLSRLGIDYFVVDISHGPLKKNASEVIALLSGKGDLPPYNAGNFTGTLL
jgi:putative protease